LLSSHGHGATEQGSRLETSPRLIRLGNRLYRAAYAYRRTVAFVAYQVIVAVAYAAAYLVRFDFAWPLGFTSVFLLSLALLLAVRFVCGVSFRLSTGRWRFVGSQDILRLLGSTATGTVLFLGLTQALPFNPRVPRSVIVLEWLLTTMLTAGMWFLYRFGYEQVRLHLSGFNGNAKRVLIVGAGEAGNLLAREMRRYPTGYRPVGFVDDDPMKWGMLLYGLEVIGATKDLAAIAQSEEVEEIIIAVPSGPPPELRRMVELCEGTGIRFKVLPGIAEVLAGDIRVNQLREVHIEDLLGREPIQLRMPELAEDLRGCTALITGAAGSIGSELARQVAMHNPASLLLFDQAETELYYLELELRERFPNMKVAFIIGDIVDSSFVDRVFREHEPDRVYHAAAYKHVPMMETNLWAALRNNVLGTLHLADAAGRHGTEKFVLVSTDKAVRPVSVMGATKRLAEMLVLEMQERYPKTTFTGVRFGNVLGSSGSVIPIFKRQLERGKALTVTHPEATRYFMTIPESVQLILQASLLSEVRGRIVMLEMGEPVRIVDLARNLLRLSGRPALRPESIVFSGLRPGEKLHEELVADGESTSATAIPKVRLVLTNGVRGGPVSKRLDEWEHAFRDGGDDLVLASLREMFPDLDLVRQPVDSPPPVLSLAQGDQEQQPRPVAG
jgi:FlaA1/EpsC-like NDP-sugar epimerase